MANRPDHDALPRLLHVVPGKDASPMIGTFQEQYRTNGDRLAKPYTVGLDIHWMPCSGPRHLAAWVVGPVAVEPDDAPFDAPACAEPTAVLDDCIMDRASRPV